MSIKLSPGQQTVFDQVMDWYRGDQQTFALAGYAGTGKTTLARYIADEVSGDETVFCAFTGKAANVLREKGCQNSGTLHKYLYSLSDHNRAEIKQLESDAKEARERGNFASFDAILKLLEQKRAEFRKPVFQLNMDSDLIHTPLVIVDEFSMLSEKLVRDLERVAKKILYLGDPFQLPPVEGKCLIEPDVFLTEIHRQAAESPIIRAATAIRTGEKLSFCNLPAMVYQSKRNIDPIEYIQAEQIIVGRNKTRQSWNARFRQRAGYAPESLPKAGEKLICLKNDTANELFNGMIGKCTDDGYGETDEHYMLDFDDIAALPVYLGDIRQHSDKYDGYNDYHRALSRFDFAYAITCHKSQGSEFDNILVYNEPIGRGEEARKWIYTALTRAQNRCVLVEP